MAGQSSSSSSRRTKRSSASSAKDASLGKKVVVDPRVRIHTLKAAREAVNLEGDDNNAAGPSNSSSTTTTSTFPSNPRSISSRANWKRVPLKRCTPHSLLVKPCGPGKIIMPSVPRRTRPSKPDGDDDDDGDTTDKEPETGPQLPLTSTSIPPPASQPLVATPASRPTSNMTLDVGQTTSTYLPLPKAPNINGSASSNTAQPTFPAPPSGTTDGSVGAVSIAPNRVAATTPITHLPSSTPARFPEYRLQPIAQPSEFDSQALQPAHPTDFPAHQHFVHAADLNPQVAQPIAHLSPQAPHPIVDVSTTNHSYHHVAGTQSQGTDEWLARQQHQPPHLGDLCARSVMDIDQDMGVPLELAYNSHASTPMAITQPPQSEALHSAFSTQINPLFDVPHQVLPPPVIESSQPAQPVHFHSATNGYENSFSPSLNQNQPNTPFLSTSLNQFGSFHQNVTHAGYALASNVGSMPTASYPPTEPFFELQWHQVQFSASAPAPGQVQQPSFHPHPPYPPPTFPVHQAPFLAPPQMVNTDYNHSSQTASACSRLISLSARKTPKPVQQKTSIVLEDETEWARRVAEVQRPQRVNNPFQSFFRGCPALIPRIDESESRVYRPLPSRVGASASRGKKIIPPVGSEEDLVARLALQREFEAEQARRALRREKRKKRAKRESDDDDEIPIKKQKIRDRSMATRKERGSCKPQPFVQPPAAKPKPLARTRSCPSVSNLMKTVLRL